MYNVLLKYPDLKIHIESHTDSRASKTYNINLSKARAKSTRDWLIERLRKLGLACDDSFTNFVLPRFKNQSQAELCDKYLQSKGFIVRRVDGYNLPEALRITIGDRNTCEGLASVIEEFLVGQK